MISGVYSALGHPLKKGGFWSSGRVGIFLPTQNFFFSFFHPPPPKKNYFNFLQKNKQRKKKLLPPPDRPQCWPPAGQKTNFFLRVALMARRSTGVVGINYKYCTYFCGNIFKIFFIFFRGSIICNKLSSHVFHTFVEIFLDWAIQSYNLR